MPYRDDRDIDLTEVNFTRGMLAGLEQRVLLDAFSGYVSAVEGVVNDGKEATVYRCRPKPEVGNGYLAAKMYRARKFRAFGNDARYVDPSRVRDRRLAKAIKQRSRKGRRLSHRMWIDHEWQVLNLLYESGASVPKPYARCNEGILMELIGDGARAAPMLVHVQLTPDEAKATFGAVLRDMEILLDCGLVHGDLSAFNILYEKGRPTIIDLPQAVEVDTVADAWLLFYRDMENICSYFRRQGMILDTLDTATRLWSRVR